MIDAMHSWKYHLGDRVAGLNPKNKYTCKVGKLFRIGWRTLTWDGSRPDYSTNTYQIIYRDGRIRTFSHITHASNKLKILTYKGKLEGTFRRFECVSRLWSPQLRRYINTSDDIREHLHHDQL